MGYRAALRLVRRRGAYFTKSGAQLRLGPTDESSTISSWFDPPPGDLANWRDNVRYIGTGKGLGTVDTRDSFIDRAEAKWRYRPPRPHVSQSSIDHDIASVSPSGSSACWQDGLGDPSCNLAKCIWPSTAFADAIHDDRRRRGGSRHLSNGMARARTGRTMDQRLAGGARDPARSRTKGKLPAHRGVSDAAQARGAAESSTSTVAGGAWTIDLAGILGKALR